MIPCDCGAPAGMSLACRPCMRALTDYRARELTILWHDAIRQLAPRNEDQQLQCFHCEGWFQDEAICGDHFPYTKGSRPDLRYNLTNGVPTCAGCNTSGARTRKPWRAYVQRVQQ